MNALDPLSQNCGPRAIENYFCAAQFWLGLVTQFVCHNSLLFFFIYTATEHTRLSPEPPSTSSESPTAGIPRSSSPSLHHADQRTKKKKNPLTCKQ